MTIINAIVKLGPDSWRVSCVLTNPELTDGLIWESEADAISFMQAHRLPYTTIRYHRYRIGPVSVEHIFHQPDADYQPNAFMAEFTDLF